MKLNFTKVENRQLNNIDIYKVKFHDRKNGINKKEKNHCWDFEMAAKHISKEKLKQTKVHILKNMDKWQYYLCYAT